MSHFFWALYCSEQRSEHRHVRMYMWGRCLETAAHQESWVGCSLEPERSALCLLHGELEGLHGELKKEKNLQVILGAQDPGYEVAFILYIDNVRSTCKVWMNVVKRRRRTSRNIGCFDKRRKDLMDWFGLLQKILRLGQFPRLRPMGTSTSLASTWTSNQKSKFYPDTRSVIYGSEWETEDMLST